MGFFDAFNPFKKKDDLGLPPLDSPPGQTPTGADFGNPTGQTPALGGLPERPPGLPDGGLGLDSKGPQMGHQDIHSTSPDTGVASFNTPYSEPSHDTQTDSRMKMPLGESIRQGHISAVHGSDDKPIEMKDHQPLHKELELISSKLDYLKASLDSINQRLVNLEHMTKEESNNRKW